MPKDKTAERSPTGPPGARRLPAERTNTAPFFFPLGSTSRGPWHVMGGMDGHGACQAMGRPTGAGQCRGMGGPWPVMGARKWNRDEPGGRQMGPARWHGGCHWGALCRAISSAGGAGAMIPDSTRKQEMEGLQAVPADGAPWIKRGPNGTPGRRRTLPRPPIWGQ